ncbi:efflux RND transporter periplasmic adaptor subunit [Flammeovirgaceae bacterium SG7u.111]|nr:efflux RND transporter periplasmic adaptor subunit [Flammeovirgaceae bacterium SG7u.132]WPO36551.1 efflux RND transporter periplasmic adaptor subunit [Flammeovirgaceae bacterium SG7u.111]
MKKIVIYGSIVIAIGFAVKFFFFSEKSSEIKVETTKVSRGMIRQVVTATGTIEPITQVEVGTQVSGVIEKIYVDYNSKVKANQLLAELDKTNLKAALREANANMASALNERDFQQKSFDRIEKLFNSKMVSDTDYEEALYKLVNAKSVVEQRSSELERTKTNLSYANIYSPIEGVVLSRSVDVGQTVAASYSTPTLFTIAQDLQQMQVEADVDEADIGGVKEGQRVVFTVDAYPGEEFEGTVTQIRLEAVVESNVVTYTVIIKADNPDGKLMPGLTASISIYTLEMENVLTLQAQALRFEPDEATMGLYMAQLEKEGEGRPPRVEVNNVAFDSKPEKPEGEMVWVKKGNEISPVPIVTGKDDGVLYQVVSGLKEGDEVVSSMKVITGSGESGEAGSSPFMQKPPGRGKKK